MVPTFLEVIEKFMDDRTMSPVEYINHGDGKREFIYMVELAANRTFHVCGINNDLTSLVITHYIPDEKNAIVKNYGGYMERFVSLGKAFESFTLVYREDNVVKVSYNTQPETFTCQFQFDSDERLNLFSYEDCNGEYFDNDMTGEFIYPTLRFHYDTFIKRASTMYRVWAEVTTEEEHFNNLEELGKRQQLNGSTEAHHQFKYHLARLRNEFSKKIFI